MTAPDVTISDVIPPACADWLAAHPEWAPIPGARYYEASHRGNGVRSLDRTVNGRRLKGRTLSASVSGTSEYPKTRITRDDGTPTTGSVHVFVLAAHAGECPEDMESLHGPGGSLDSRYCGCGTEDCTEGNLGYGTHERNVRETIEAGNARRPATFPCINHARCDGMAVNEGSRCGPCAVKVGERAGLLLTAGMNSKAAAKLLGYKSDSWVVTLASRHGGYTGTLAQARTQRLPWWQQVMATVRYHLSRGDGQ